MNLRLLATPLLATGLLLSTLGCSKKEEAAPTATSSYKLDNATISCQAKASTSTVLTNGISTDYLFIDLVTTPEPATGPETLRLYFVKPNVPTSNTYTLYDIGLANDINTIGYSFFVTSGTITSTSNGGYSGTFAGKINNSIRSTPAPYTTITSGTFTDVHP
jgi:hypothetical protein